ncbi:hypothetical protein HPB50_029250 [Hyalomma asiaticum]|nr:hypothetical protein HPB50_029250 [Hyalomma asiaticum]
MLPMDIDNELLISSVAARSILWQVKNTEFKNKVKKNALWLEVTAAVLPGVTNAGWKPLRDKFRRLWTQLKAAHKSGAGAEDTDEINVSWPYFEMLLFLKDSIEGRATSGNMKSTQAILLDLSGSHSSYSDVDTLSVDMEGNSSQSECFSQECPLPLPENTPAATSEAEISSEVAPHLHQPKPPQKRKKHADLFIEELSNVQNELNNCAPKDADEHFALALLGHMRAVKPEKKLDMHLKLLQVVKEFQNNE